MDNFEIKPDRFNAAQDWFYDRYHARETEAKRYLVMSIVFATLLGICLVGLLILLPLKRTIMEPYVVLIDNVTGITATLTSSKASDFTEHTTVTRYFLSRYVKAREGYTAATIPQQINLVRAFSTPEAFVTFKNEWEDIKHQEERQALSSQGELNAEILSVTFPLPDIAHVRYMLTERRAGNSMRKSTWLATLKLAQVAEVDIQLAELNPLGLVITHYETTKESNHVLSDEDNHNNFDNI